MKVDANVVAAVAIFLIAQAVAIVGAWWDMRSKVQAHESKLAQIESDHKKEVAALVAGHTALRETVGGIQLEIAKGFARIEEQIKTLFRDQEKHP